jgi:hypothetical protein
VLFFTLPVVIAMLGIGHLVWGRSHLDRDEKRFWWHFAVVTTWAGLLITFFVLALTTTTVSHRLIVGIMLVSTLIAVLLYLSAKFVYPEIQISIMEANLNPEQQVNLIRITFPENKKRIPIEREAHFYFISVRNENGPTIENFQVDFNARTKGKGWGKRLELISPTDKNVFTIPARPSLEDDYTLRGEQRAWFSTMATSKYQKESLTLYEKGPANKTLEFALFYTIKDGGCVTFPSESWRHFQLPCEFRIRINFFGDGLPYYHAATYRVKITEENWNNPEVQRVAPADDSEF